MPDRWEKRHKVKKARGDADRDGLRNRDEYIAKTNPRRRDTDRDGLRDGDEIRFGWHPRKRDTDRDGIRDGKENAGVVVAVAGRRVTIALARGGRLSGRLDDPAALTCVAAPAPGTSPSGADWLPDGAERGDPSAPEDETFWDPAWGEQPADLDGDEDEAAEDEGPPPPASTSQPEEDGESVDEDEAAAEAADIAADEAAAAADCAASLRTGSLVHEATFEPGPTERRLTSLRLVS